MELPTRAEKAIIAKRFLSDDAANEPEKYEIYFRYYETLFKRSSEDYVVNVTKPAYSNHAEVVSFFDKLILDVSQTKADFCSIFPVDVPTAAREHAVQILIHASLMVDCASKHKFPEGHKVRDFWPRSWGEQQPLADFVEGCFPSPTQPPEIRKEAHSAMAQRGRLKAWKLKERYKVRLRTTDNLAEHLVFDTETRVLYVFRQVGFLKAHLYRSRNEHADASFKESLQRGTLPPQLLLEILDSIQYLLFPNDERSLKSLDNFINNHGFDPKAKYFESHVRELPDDFEYEYLGDRLAALLRIVDHPPPANSIVAWFERHTSERNALTVAILGLFLTALLGFLSLVIALVAVVYGAKQYIIAVKALQASPIPSPT